MNWKKQRRSRWKVRNKLWKCAPEWLSYKVNLSRPLRGSNRFREEEVDMEQEQIVRWTLEDQVLETQVWTLILGRTIHSQESIVMQTIIIKTDQCQATWGPKARIPVTGMGQVRGTLLVTDQEVTTETKGSCQRTMYLRTFVDLATLELGFPQPDSSKTAESDLQAMVSRTIAYHQIDHLPN